MKEMKTGKIEGKTEGKKREAKWRATRIWNFNLKSIKQCSLDELPPGRVLINIDILWSCPTQFTQTPHTPGQSPVKDWDIR